jgi:WD40 repeat protein
MDETCGRFDALIARASQLTAEQAAELAVHLEGCPSCRELARAMKPVTGDTAFAATGASDTVLSGDGGNTARGDDQFRETTSDRYRITGEVGRGGIGRVLRALDQVLDRPVALKELSRATDGMRRRFVREALITARLQHPSIVPVYDAGHLGDLSPFYAMKLVAGRPLDKAIADATTLAQRLALLPSVLAVADAMAYAHSERIIHRDLKPQNVLVGKYGETIVIDWGLAKDLAVDDSDALDAGPYRAASLEQTVAGVLLGTPAYMAPEQAAGEPLDERADVYALGAILYHVVCGAIPHEGTTLDEMVERVIGGKVRPLIEREPDVPRDLAAIVSKAMALEPAARYSNAQGLADDLRRFLNGQLVASHTYRTRELVLRWLKRHRATVSVALAALLVVSVVGIVSVVRIVHARQQTETELAELLVEQGRQELVAGRPARAAVYLSQAYARAGEPSVALRSYLADAMRSIDAERMTLDGHTGALTSAKFSPDGTRIVTADRNGTARVWDAATGQVVTPLPSDGQRTISFSPDGSRIVTAGNNHRARLWDARTGKLLATFDDNDDVFWAGFSPDGARLLTTGRGGVAKLWDAKTTQLVLRLDGASDDLNSAAFSADSARVIATSVNANTVKVWDANTGKLMFSIEGRHDAAFSADGSQIITVSDDDRDAGATPKLWDASTGTLLRSLEGPTPRIHSAKFSPDGSHIVTVGEDNSAKLWDAHTGKLLKSLEGHVWRVWSATFSPDGTRVATAGYDHTAKLWDVETGTLLASFETHHDAVASARFSPNGSQIVTASNDGTAKLWDATPSKVRMSLDGLAGGAGLTNFNRDGSRLATIVRGDHDAKLWDTRTGKLLVSLGHRDEVVDAELNSSGTLVVTTSADHTVKLWDTKTGKLIVSFDDNARGAVVTPDGTRVVTAAVDHGARIWDTKTGKWIATLDGTNLPHFVSKADFVNTLSISEDSARVVTASQDGTARVWRLDDGKLVAQLDGHADEVMTATFSEDGARVVTASKDKTAKIWDATTGKLLASLEGHTNAVVYARFSRDGTRVVTTSVDHSARLWDARTGEMLASLDGHTNALFIAGFSPDPEGARVFTTSLDHTVKLWDTRSGKLLASLDGHTGEVLNAGFTPDGTHVMTAGSDGRIWTWDVPLEARTPDAVESVVSARDPWTFSNGGLVPVSGVSKIDSHVDDHRGASDDTATAGTVTSNDDYVAKWVALLSALVDLFKTETDCEVMAANIRSFMVAAAPTRRALAAWRAGHTIDQAALVKAMLPVMTAFRATNPVTEAMSEKCKHDKAFIEAMETVTASMKN